MTPAETVCRPLELVDTTLREGAQSSLLHDHAKYAFTREDKLAIVRALILFGVRQIELFSPIVGANERDDLAAIQEMRNALAADSGRAELLAHVRCHADDIDAALAAGFDGLHLFLGVSPVSRGHTSARTLDVMARDARRLIEAVRRDHPALTLRFSGEDAFRTPLDDLCRLYDEVAPTVDRLGVPDTVGVATQPSVICRLSALRARYPHMEWEAHFHDDRGLALANTLTAVESGVRFIDTTVLGIGERSGITSTTALLFNLFLNARYDLLTDYRLADSFPLNVLVASTLNRRVHDKEPVSLMNRTHVAGVHQRAVIMDPTAYEAHPLDRFGVTSTEMLLGPLTGWHLIYYVLREIECFDVDEETARAVAATFKDHSIPSQNEVCPMDRLIHLATSCFGLKRTRGRTGARPSVGQSLDPTVGTRSVTG